jgi:antitoxin component YwqK of YwqJK toxin-antitoxin module
MKKYIVIGTMLITGMIFAQNNTVTPKLEAVGNLVKATYVYDNGQVKQVGFYENGKLQGKWVSYDVNGKKTAVAEYNKGQKVGKWFFWNNSVLSEVDYSDNRVASVKNWKEDAIANVD